MSGQPINCQACGKAIVTYPRTGRCRKGQRFCSKKCARSMRIPTYRPAEERFKEKIIVEPSGCWRWTASTMGSGYGRFKIRGRKSMIAAHIFAYEQKYGPVPDGKELDHLCRNRWCCNPDHVEPVTHQVNVVRGNAPNMILHRSGKCRRGHEQNETNTKYQTRNGKRHRAFCKICKQLDRNGGDDA